MKTLRTAWEEIRYLSVKLIMKVDCPRSFIGGMLNAIPGNFTVNNNIKKQQT
tara:strand:+ start:353 stop:508 length:156 start_codon:yes stop_codon:yes gene_type:complete